MGSTFTNLTYHVVFSTKYRKRRITTVREELYNVIGGIIRNHDGTLLEIGGIEDHVHLLISIPAKIAVADMMRFVKTNSAKWCNEQKPMATKFQWQKGYAALTVSYSKVATVRRYIQNQEQHHKEQSFEEEFVALLERHGIEYDPGYVFEMEPISPLPGLHCGGFTVQRVP